MVSSYLKYGRWWVAGTRWMSCGELSPMTIPCGPLLDSTIDP